MKSISTYIIESITGEDTVKKYANMIVVSPDNEILILQRAYYLKDFRGLWGFPGGSVDKKDNSVKVAAIRELKEETGIELTFNEETMYCKQIDDIENKDGSHSIYFLVKLETKPEVKISKEHREYKWYSKNNQEVYKWMPDVFQLIQKVYNDEIYDNLHTL